MNNEIEKLVIDYFEKVNESDVEGILSLYTEDGVFMPSNNPTYSGKTEVKNYYIAALKKKKPTLNFTFVEIIENADLAIVRTLSKGTSVLNETKEIVNEESRELFVLKNVYGEWKIARYIINKLQ